MGILFGMGFKKVKQLKINSLPPLMKTLKLLK